MPRLVVLNGPPGIGKSTLARRWVHDHPLAACLDLDGVRRTLGRWDAHVQESGLLARAMGLAMARTHLAAGHDVVVPQHLGRPAFLEQLEALATATGATFVELVLLDDRAAALARFHARATDPALADHHREAVATGGGDDELGAMYDRLVALLPSRPRARVVRTVAGRVDDAHRAVTAAVDELSRAAPDRP